MLNISKETIEGKVQTEHLKTPGKIAYSHIGRRPARMLFAILIMLIVVAFLPWTQQIRAKGKVTALNPGQRPQTVNAVIPGQIVKWYVQEGDFVQAGDTLVQFSEVKDAYFDPKLLERTEDQIKAKEGSVKSYMDKVQALDDQIDAMNRTKKIKITQNRNDARQMLLKMEADSNAWTAARINREIALEQLKRNEELYKKGIKSLTEVENFRQKAQETKAYEIAAENKFLASKNEYLNVIAELESIEFQFRDKISKAESDKFTAISDLFNTENEVTKLQNQLANYTVRAGNYFITAPQDGYVTQALKAGIGETVKEDEALMNIMPKDFEPAVEMYIRPIDLPLIRKGDKVRFIFDGWPAFVFSGWPGLSYGTYGGEVFAIDNFSSPEGMYRILVKEDPTDHPWPEAIRPGGGAIGFSLLGNVHIWFEIWRQINGFPPDFYRNGEKKSEPAQEKEKK